EHPANPPAVPALPQRPPSRSACPPAIPALSKPLPSGSARSSAERVAHTRQSLAGSMIVGPGIPAPTDEPRDGDDESDEDERHEHIDVRTGELGPPRSRQQMAPEGVLGKEQRADDGDEGTPKARPDSDLFSTSCPDGMFRSTPRFRRYS